MTENEFNRKLYESIKQSIEKITPPPFYQVLQKAAQDDSIENYDEIFGDTFNKKSSKKPLAAKIIGVAAAVTIFIGLSLAIGSMYYMGRSKADECAQDYSSKFKYSEDSQNGSQSTEDNDQVSPSDIEDDVSSQTYAE